jgi:hypothetical protein
MTAKIVLTDDEAQALREVLAALSVIEDRDLRHDHVIEITRETWRDLLLRPASRLRRVGRPAIEAAIRGTTPLDGPVAPPIPITRDRVTGGPIFSPSDLRRRLAETERQLKDMTEARDVLAARLTEQENQP